MLGFLTSEDSLTIPDKIEEVNAEYLTKIVSDEKYVTVLFFDESKGISKQKLFDLHKLKFFVIYLNSKLMIILFKLKIAQTFYPNWRTLMMKQTFLKLDL